MKVLVTGATGFVGRHLVPQLLAAGHDVTALARNEVRAREFSWFDQVNFVACDIHTQLKAAPRSLMQHDAVIHLAWPGLPNYKDLFHFEDTLPADYRFLKWLVEGGIKHLLVTGTCFEYGMQCGCLAEDLPTDPQNPYALAKDTLRKFLEILCPRYEVTLQWARLFYMHGSGQNSKSLLAQLDQALESGAKVFNMSEGEQLRDYLHVDIVARYLVVLFSKPDCSGPVNICSGRPISVRRLVERHLTQQSAAIKLNLGYYPYPDYEPMAFWGSRKKLDRLMPSF